jgi:hypothetical protein
VLAKLCQMISSPNNSNHLVNVESQVKILKLLNDDIVQISLSVRECLSCILCCTSTSWDDRQLNLAMTFPDPLLKIQGIFLVAENE